MQSAASLQFLNHEKLTFFFLLIFLFPQESLYLSPRSVKLALATGSRGRIKR